MCSWRRGEQMHNKCVCGGKITNAYAATKYYANAFVAGKCVLKNKCVWRANNKCVFGGTPKHISGRQNVYRVGSREPCVTQHLICLVLANLIQQKVTCAKNEVIESMGAASQIKVLTKCFRLSTVHIAIA